MYLLVVKRKMQPFISTLATVFERNSAATKPAKLKYRRARRSPQARKRRIFLLNSKVKETDFCPVKIDVLIPDLNFQDTNPSI